MFVLINDVIFSKITVILVKKKRLFTCKRFNRSFHVQNTSRKSEISAQAGEVNFCGTARRILLGQR